MRVVVWRILECGGRCCVGRSLLWEMLPLIPGVEIVFVSDDDNDDDDDDNNNIVSGDFLDRGLPEAGSLPWEQENDPRYAGAYRCRRWSKAKDATKWYYHHDHHRRRHRRRRHQRNVLVGKVGAEYDLLLLDQIHLKNYLHQ